MSKKAILWLFIFTLTLGVFFRFYLIQEIPLGLYPDEAMNGNNALEALTTGRFKIFYPENNGREGLFINLQALSIKIFGNEPWALRVISAIFGTLTILGVYFVTKELFISKTTNSELRNPIQTVNPNYLTPKLFGNWKLSPMRHSRFGDGAEIGNYAIALLASFFTATSYWHLNFSRIGFRAIMVPLLATFGLYFLLKGLRTGRISDLIFSGILVGLGFHTYIAFRFMPFIIAIPLGWYLWQWSKEIQNSKFKNKNEIPKSQNTVSCTPCAIILFLFVTFVVALPIGYYFLQSPQDFVGRSGQISIFAAPSPLTELSKSAGLTFQMFFWQGDCNWRHNFNCQSELHPLVALFFAIGLVVAVWNLEIRKSRNLLKIENWKIGNLILLAWFIFMSLPAILTREGLPHALRSIGMIPPVMILAGLGAWQFLHKILDWFEFQKSKWLQRVEQAKRIKREICLLFILAIVFIPLSTYRIYFLKWAESPQAYFAFSNDLYHLGQFLNGLPQDTKKYVVVNIPGVEVRGIPMPAQTVMFVTDTFREEERNGKNIYYLIPPDFSQGLRMKEQDKVVISFLNSADLKLIHLFQQKFPKFKVWAPADFVAMQNY